MGRRDGYAIPLDVLSVDRGAYASTLSAEGRRAIGRLRDGGALLSETAAGQRRIGRGGTLTLTTGRRLRVRGVIADQDVRGAEVVVASGSPNVTTQPVNVLAILRPEAHVRLRALARTAGDGAAARILDTASRPNDGRGLARPAELKARFGEPAVGLPYGDDWVRLDPGFLERHIVTRTVPVLGSVTCHRQMIAPLRAAIGAGPARSLEARRPPATTRAATRQADPPGRQPLAARVAPGRRPQRVGQPAGR